MNLREFIRDTITELIGGVVDAQKEAADLGGRVVPPGWRHDSQVTSKMTLLQDGSALTLVEFDVALTSSDSKETKGGVGVFLGTFTLGSGGSSKSGESSLSRIRFMVPISLPPQPR